MFCYVFCAIEESILDQRTVVCINTAMELKLKP